MNSVGYVICLIACFVLGVFIAIIIDKTIQLHVKYYISKEKRK